MLRNPPRASPRTSQNIHKYCAFMTMVWGRGAFMVFAGTLALAQVSGKVNRWTTYNTLQRVNLAALPLKLTVLQQFNLSGI